MTKQQDGPGHDAGPLNPGRRAVIRSGAGLVIAVSWFNAPAALGFASGKPQDGNLEAARADGNPPFAPNAFIRIDTDGSIRLVMPEVEMGQGSYTGQATLIAEELCVDLDQVRLEHAPPNEALYSFENQGFQVTGSSGTIRGAWGPLREAGAVARMMLTGAAAKRWGVPVGECQVERGVVRHAKSQRQASFGQLALEASHQPVPETAELLSAKSYRLIGKSLRRVDVPPKTDGSLPFGIDVRVPGMKVAAVAHPPRIGGRVRHVDDRRARARAGVADVIVLADAVAVTATDFWTARKALGELVIDWDPGPNATVSSASIAAEMEHLSATGKPVIAKDAGSQAHRTLRRVEATYTLPMLAHATMEPMNALVWVRKDACDIWVGTQVPTRVVDVAINLTKLPASKITVHPQYIGGGFGRRLETDWVEQAIAIAMQVPYPVKLIWTREQDIAGDAFRPPYHDHLAATLDGKGLPATWLHRDTSDSVTDRWSPGDMGKDGLDPDCVDSAIEPPYELPNMRVEWVRHHLPRQLKIGWWRGVGPTHNLFPVESFIDELAHATGQDPLAYRRALLAKNPRARAVLDLAAEKFDWDGKPAGHRVGRGIALGACMATLLAAIVEVEVSPQGEIRMRRAVCAVDCGVVVNPDTIAAQIQGGLIFGWSAALFGRVTLDGGVIEQHNFHDYRVLRANEIPLIEVYTVPSTEAPTGIGEPGTAIAAPCLANAIYAATGVRLRSLPFDRTALVAGASSLDEVVS